MPAEVERAAVLPKGAHLTAVLSVTITRESGEKIGPWAFRLDSRADGLIVESDPGAPVQAHARARASFRRLLRAHKRNREG